MTPQELVAFGERAQQRHDGFVVAVEALDPAPADALSTEDLQDVYAEAIFIRAFTAYENDLEKLFLHYVTGGTTRQGAPANTYLRITDEQHARKLTRAGFKFLSWAKPSETRATAQNYIENGWPISNMLSAKSQELTDCEKVRNRIAHNSLEATLDFNAVQRNMLQTERLFPITPGQFLRIRSTRLKRLHMVHYLEAMNDTLVAIMDPPP